jgi:quercetin dioxygenase-like cupin family protein
VRGISFVNLTIGITYTAPGGAPPIHTHLGEEAHVLTDRQKIRYALGDEVFDLEGPYIVNLPPMVPHSFQNLDDEVAELVVIFPTNVERTGGDTLRSRRRMNPLQY